MAVLSTVDRAALSADMQRQFSRTFETIALTKPEIQAAIDATDAWIDANASTFNLALPEAARTNLTAKQKTRLFFAVASRRLEVS